MEKRDHLNPNSGSGTMELSDMAQILYLQVLREIFFCVMCGGSANNVTRTVQI